MVSRSTEVAAGTPRRRRPAPRPAREGVSRHGVAPRCPSRIRCQAATGSWTKSRQWETQRTLFSSARATMCPPTKVDGVWPFNDAWLRTSLLVGLEVAKFSFKIHGHSRTAYGRDILAASCRSGAPRMGGTGAPEARS